MTQQQQSQYYNTSFQNQIRMETQPMIVHVDGGKKKKGSLVISMVFTLIACAIGIGLLIKVSEQKPSCEAQINSGIYGSVPPDCEKLQVHSWTYGN